MAVFFGLCVGGSWFKKNQANVTSAGLCLCLHRLRDQFGDGGAEHCHVSVLLLLSSLQLVVDLHLYGGLSIEHMSEHSPFHGADSQDHGRLSIVGRARIHTSEQKKNLHVLDSLVRTTKKWGGVVTSNHADACAFISYPQLSSCRRRFQTTETPEKLAHMFRLLGPCIEPLQRNLHTSFDSLVRVSSWVKSVRNFAHMLDSSVRMPRDTLGKLAFL